MRLTLKAINDELAKRLCRPSRAAATSIFSPAKRPADWLDRTVNAPTVNSLSLAEWMAEFERLKRVNAEIMGAVRVEGAEPETVYSPKMKSLQQIGE